MINLDVNVNMGNLQNILGVMVPIIAIAGGLTLTFAMRYLKSKERMEMISRGMDVSAFKEMDIADSIRKKSKKNPLRQGLIALGAGLGLLVSYALCHTIFTGNDNEIIYFGVVAVFVGIALILSHMLEKKDPAENN